MNTRPTGEYEEFGEVSLPILEVIPDKIYVIQNVTYYVYFEGTAKEQWVTKKEDLIARPTNIENL